MNELMLACAFTLLSWTDGIKGLIYAPQDLDPKLIVSLHEAFEKTEQDMITFGCLRLDEFPKEQFLSLRKMRVEQHSVALSKRTRKSL